MNDIITKLNELMADTLANLKEAKCPKAMMKYVAHEWNWLQSDIMHECDSIKQIVKSIIRHTARCCDELERAEASRVYVDEAYDGFVALRKYVEQRGEE